MKTFFLSIICGLITCAAIAQELEVKMNEKLTFVMYLGVSNFVGVEKKGFNETLPKRTSSAANNEEQIHTTEKLSQIFESVFTKQELERLAADNKSIRLHFDWDPKGVVLGVSFTVDLKHQYIPSCPISDQMIVPLDKLALLHDLLIKDITFDPMNPAFMKNRLYSSVGLDFSFKDILNHTIKEW